MWLPLAEYSMKHKVSISTLRRRIKAEDIKYRLDDGRYMIFDDQNAIDTHRPSLSEAQQEDSNSHFETLSPYSAGPEQTQKEPVKSMNKIEGESVITAANRLLADLKKAYTQVLQEKEQQILDLKEEIADLRTLVRILESENERLKPSSVASQHQSQYQNVDY